jgi:hypothetical protein
MTDPILAPLSPAERQEAERLCAQATRGPWDPDEEIIQARDPVVTVAFCSGRTDNDLNDAAFISQARTLLPRALATITQLELEIAGYEHADSDANLALRAQLTALTQERDALKEQVTMARGARDFWQDACCAANARAVKAEAALRAAQGREQKVREFTLAIFNAIGSDISPREAGDALNREYPIKDRSVL